MHEQPAIDQILRPDRPQDDLSFEQLAERYNFRNSPDRRVVFTRLILQECRRRPSPVRVLDVGCGRGIGRSVDCQWAIRQCVDELWGIEPDESVEPPENLFDRHCQVVLEEAELPERHFDIAYSFMVMEHVERPDDFMAAVLACLKPGGVYVMATPNKRHWFTRTASLLHTLRLDERVLALVRKGHAEEYHYPVAYRFNDPGRIRRCARRTGFLEPDFAYLEAAGARGYVPRPLRPLYGLLALKRKLWRSPESLITLFCRLTRPPAAGSAPSPPI